MKKFRFIVVGFALVLITFGMGTYSHADDLDDRRDAIEKQLAQAKAKTGEKRQVAQNAQEALAQAEQELVNAQQALSNLEQKLAEAQVKDKALAQELAQAKEELAKAVAEREAGQKQVDEQRELIGKVSRESYRQRSDLQSVAVLLGSQSPKDLASRVQWNDLVFQSTSAQLNRYQEALAKLRAAEQKQSEIEAKISQNKAESEKNVQDITQLKDAAAKQKNNVAELVANRDQAKKQADQDLSNHLENIKKLEADFNKIQNQIKAELSAKEEQKAALNNGRFIWGVSGPISSGFGYRTHPITGYRLLHEGIDIVASCGTPIKSAGNGVVRVAGYYGTCGNAVRIDNGNMSGKNVQTLACHMSSVAVSRGQRVQQGQIIGYVGSTGYSTGCHLHFGVYENGVPVSPFGWLQ